MYFCRAELVTLLLNYLEENLWTLWTQLDQLQQAAVAEVVHSLESRFPTDRFQAKYRQLPNWGSSDRYRFNRQPSLLGLFFYSNVMPEDLKQRLQQFVPQPAAAKMKTIDQPPNIFHLRWKQFDFDLRKPMTVSRPSLNGSRQEEAQRLGRILRLKQDNRRAHFYTLVSLQTCEEEFARHRQLFLTEQGYSYQIKILN